MAVVETGDDGATVQINGRRIRLAPCHDLPVVADGREQSLVDGNRRRGRMGGIQRGDPAIEQYGVDHGLVRCVLRARCGQSSLALSEQRRAGHARDAAEENASVRLPRSITHLQRLVMGQVASLKEVDEGANGLVWALFHNPMAGVPEDNNFDL